MTEYYVAIDANTHVIDLEASSKLADLCNRDIPMLKCPKHPKAVNKIALRVVGNQADFALMDGPCCPEFERDIRIPLAMYLRHLDQEGKNHLWMSKD